MPKPSTLLSSQALNVVESYRRHYLYEAKLGYTVEEGEGGLLSEVCRKTPNVVVSAVGGVYDSKGVGLQDAIAEEGGRARDDVGFVALWQPHGDAKGEDVEFACIESKLIAFAIPLKETEWRRWVNATKVEVYPVAMTLEGRHIGQVAFYVKSQVRHC